MKKRSIMLIITLTVLIIAICVCLVVFLVNKNAIKKDEKISISLDELDKKIDQSNEF